MFQLLEPRLVGWNDVDNGWPADVTDSLTRSIFSGQLYCTGEGREVVSRRSVEHLLEGLGWNQWSVTDRSAWIGHIKFCRIYSVHPNNNNVLPFYSSHTVYLNLTAVFYSGISVKYPKNHRRHFPNSPRATNGSRKWYFLSTPTFIASRFTYAHDRLRQANIIYLPVNIIYRCCIALKCCAQVAQKKKKELGDVRYTRLDFPSTLNVWLGASE